MGPSVLVLGPVEARGPAGPIPIAGVKLQAVLAMLALAVPNAVSADRLMEELWGDSPPLNPTNSLQAQISQLRRLLGRDVVARRGAGYALDVPPENVDSQRLDRLAALARNAAVAGDHRGAAQHFHSAIALFRGAVLAGLSEYDFARASGARYDEFLLSLREGLIDAELAAGRHADVMDSVSELVRVYPMRERFAAQHITALYRCGRQVDALRSYAQVRTLLIDEFGIEPGLDLQALERAVLAQDPALAYQPPADSASRSEAVAATPVRSAVVDLRAGSGPAVGRVPLLGRDAEMELLHRDLGDVFGGRGRIALLVGEPGIGKTRLAEEIVAQS